MADAIISAAVERIAPIIEEQIRTEVNLARGVKKEVRKLSNDLKTIRNVLDDAERRGPKEKSIEDWLKKLEDISYEMDDVLDEWNIANLKLRMEHGPNDAVVAPQKQKVCPSMQSSCLCFKKLAVRRNIAKKIENLKEQLDLILVEKDRYNFAISQPATDPSPRPWRVQSTSEVDVAEVHGRETDKEILVSKLMSSGGGQEGGLHILSVVGVGGIGKTTLAQLVFNDSWVKESFDLRIWICVSDPFDLAAIARGIVEGAGKGGPANTSQLDMLFKLVKDSISGKKFLLVLDDVWTQEYAKWEPLEKILKYGGAGSKILVTTRNESIAKMMGTRDSDICHLGQLSDDDCWLLLCRMALKGNKEEIEIFQNVGKKIAKKCKGLPLAAKVLGSLLHFKNSLEEWENVLNSEIWQLEEAKVEIFPHLLLSYNELSPALKHCFSYCAVFPKDYEIEVEKLIGNWMALGYLGPSSKSASDMELKGRECFNNLATRSLFQDFRKDDTNRQVKSFKMHDVVHDFAQSLRKTGRAETAGMEETTCRVCDLPVGSVKEYRSLFWDKKQRESLCDCLTSLRALGLTNYRYFYGIPQGVGNLIHLRWLDLSRNDLTEGDLKTICELYNLQTLHLHDCSLQEIPREIGNLIHLIHLNLSENAFVDLPESICDLQELQTLDVHSCYCLVGLPQDIGKLVNLKRLYNEVVFPHKFSPGLAQLTGLRTLSQFRGGSGWGKLGWLKNLNRLSGSLTLWIRLSVGSEDMVADAREAELREKKHIEMLTIRFSDEMDEKTESGRMDVLGALKPHPNLRNLEIQSYKGSKLPVWIASPLSQLRSIKLYSFSHLSSLPPLGKLPCLEEIYIIEMLELQYVGREFLGMTATKDLNTSSSSSSSSVPAATSTVGFPKLKVLEFDECPEWREWEDITAEEEDSTAVSLMPRLTKLSIRHCEGLRVLPHRLLRKMSSLEELDICGSMQLGRRYGRRDGSAWKSRIRKPGLQLKL